MQINSFALFSTKDVSCYFGSVDKVDIWINRHATHWSHYDPYILGYYITNTNHYITHLAPACPQVAFFNGGC